MNALSGEELHVRMYVPSFLAARMHYPNIDVIVLRLRRSGLLAGRLHGRASPPPGAAPPPLRTCADGGPCFARPVAVAERGAAAAPTLPHPEQRHLPATTLGLTV